MIRAVVFDFGEVMSSPADLYATPARRLGVEPSAYESLYWTGREIWDGGGPAERYWGPLLSALGKPDTPEMVQFLGELDSEVWLRGIRPDALQLMADVRKAGRLVAVLSNASFSLDMALADSEHAEVADYWFVSASMGVMKPDPAVYRRVEEVLELRGGEIAFVDDRSENLDAAQAFGWATHLFTSDAATREWLAGLEVL